MKIIWTHEEVEYLKDNYLVMTDDEMIEKLNKTKTQIRDKRNHEQLGRPSKISKEFLISEFWRFYNENERYPIQKDLNTTNGYPHGISYSRKWGSWSNFLKEIDVLGEDGWYKCDEQVLRNLYENFSCEDINSELMIKRSYSAIKHKANKLGLYIRHFKSEEEYQLIIQDYLNGINCPEIAKKYGYTDGASIYYVLRKYNISLNRNNYWTDEQIVILKNYYPTTEWEELLDLLSPFRKEDIIHKAYKLKINRLLNADYSEKEVDILKEYFGKLPTKELLELLPHRTESAINCKASKLGLESRIKWTDEEIERLKVEYPYHLNDELSRIFVNRTADAIMGMAVKLGLSKDKNSHLEAIYNKEMLISEFQDFAKELGHTPISIEVSANKNMAHAKTYERYFGSYTNACREAGLVPCYDNSVYVTHVYYSKNNDICLSQTELIITNLFIDNNVEYLKEVLYRDLVKDDYRGFKRCDWLLGDLVVEYYGMPERTSYQKRIIEKRELCEKNGIHILELYPDDVKRGRNLDGLVEKFKSVGIELRLDMVV